MFVAIIAAISLISKVKSLIDEGVIGNIINIQIRLPSLPVIWTITKNLPWRVQQIFPERLLL